MSGGGGKAAAVRRQGEERGVVPLELSRSTSCYLRRSVIAPLLWVLLVGSLSIGCGRPGGPAGGSFADLGIVNNSDTRIHAWLTDGDHIGPLPLVMPHCERTWGGGSFTIGGKVKVVWETWTNGKTSKQMVAVCDTKPLVPLIKRLGALRCVYSSDGKWTMIVHERRGGSFEQGPELIRLDLIPEAAASGQKAVGVRPNSSD